MADKVITSSTPCDCCGAAGCDLTMPTLIVDGTTTPYADLAAATAAIAAQAANGCLAEGSIPTSVFASQVRDLFDTAFVAGLFTIAAESTTTSGDVEGCEEVFTARVFLTAADGISIDYDFLATFPGASGPTHAYIEIYEDDETTLVDFVADVPFGATSPYNFAGTFAPTIPMDGYYRIKIGVNITSDTSGVWTFDTSLDITGGDSLLPCTVRAAYGGTPDYLACV